MVNYKQLNDLNFLKKLKLLDLVRDTLKLSMDNGVTDTDYYMLAAITEYWYSREITDRERLISNMGIGSKEMTIANNTDNISLFINEISKQMFTSTFITTTVSSATNEIKVNNKLFDEVVYRLADISDECHKNKFKQYLERGNYSLAVYSYLSIMCSGRLTLLSDITTYMNDTSNAKNFVYQLNRELLNLGNSMLQYGKNISNQKVSDELIKMSDDAVHETRNKMIESNDRLYEEIRSLNEQIRDMSNVINKLTEENTDLKDKRFNKLNNLKILILGDEGRKVNYMEVLSKYGTNDSNVTVVSGVDKSTNFVKEKALSHDIIFLFTDYMKHKTSAPLKELNNVILLNNTGMKTFEDKIIEMDVAEYVL